MSQDPPLHSSPMPCLVELLRQVRGFTLELIDSTPEDWLLWAPTGTSNHILWHAGHVLWLQDRLSVQVLSGTSALPDGWSDTFGSDCRPPAETNSWPSISEVRQQLSRQRDQLKELYVQADNEQLNAALVGILHGWHDEALHQGEIYLLYKMQRGKQQNIG